MHQGLGFGERSMPPRRLSPTRFFFCFISVIFFYFLTSFWLCYVRVKFIF